MSSLVIYDDDEPYYHYEVGLIPIGGNKIYTAKFITEKTLTDRDINNVFHEMTNCKVESIKRVQKRKRKKLIDSSPSNVSCSFRYALGGINVTSDRIFIPQVKKQYLNDSSIESFYKQLIGDCTIRSFSIK